MSSLNSGASASAHGGLGIFGALIILGLLGIGPCADDLARCGPTPVDVYRQIKAIQCEAGEGMRG